MSIFYRQIIATVKDAMQRLVKAFLCSVVIACAVGSGMTTANARDFSLAGGTIGDRFGVHVKGQTSPQDLDQIRAAGFGLIRYAMDWSYVERKRGWYDWAEADALIEQARARKLRSIIILVGGNAAYSGEYLLPRAATNFNHVSRLALAPKDPPVIEGFARFAQAAASRYRGDDVIWEIWNEPDRDDFWPPKADPRAYTSLAISTCEAIRKADPSARIVAPGTAAMPTWRDRLGLGFIGAVLQSPLKSCLDAISFHSYRMERGMPPKSPESVMPDNERARAIVGSHTTDEGTLQVVCSEWGYNSLELTESQQASYVMRTYFANLLSGVPITVWYEWRDSMLEPNDTEAHYGLVDVHGKEKRAVQAVKSVLPMIRGDRLERRMPVGGPQDFVLLLSSPDNDKKLVAWTVRNASEGTVHVGIVGTARRIVLTATPQVIDLKATIPQLDVSVVRDQRQ
jgi:hypothetical protein